MMKKNLQERFDEFMFEREFVSKVRKQTLRGYRTSFLFFKKIIPDVTIDTLDSTHVLLFFKILQERKRIVGKGMIKTGVKKSTIATYWSKLNTFFEWLKKNKYINLNPFIALPYPTPHYEDKKFLKKEEIEKIIAAIHLNHEKNILLLKRNLVIFYLLLFCGLRKEELLQLQIGDIDFERRYLTIRANTSKSGRTRQTPLHSCVRMYLKDYLHERKNYKTEFLIVSKNQDNKLTADGLKHVVSRLKTLSAVNFHLHQFRHTFAVNFLKTSNNIVYLKQLLGHKSLSMTLTYLRCLPVDEMRGDIESMSIDKFI